MIPSKPMIRVILERGDRVVYVGSKSGLEQDLVADMDVEYKGITTGKLRRYLSFANLIDAFRVPIGILQSILLLAKTRPVALFSKGGYVAFPVVFAGWLLRVPVVAHESDLTPGLATRLCTPFIKTQCVNFDQTRTKARRVVVTGTPIRSELLEGDAKRGRDWLGLSSPKPVLVVVGGSLGAEEINRVVRDAVMKLVEDFTVVHVCGQDNIDESLAGLSCYYQYEFIREQWGDVLALADVVVSRSGANSLFELLTLRKPNILIPLPLKSSRGDQIENAEYSELRGWSLVVPEDLLTPESLCSSLSLVSQDLANWKTKIEEFPRRDSLSLIIEEIDRVAK